MMRSLLFIVFVLWALPLRAEHNTLLILGDSLSSAYGMAREAGWVALLERRLSAAGAPWAVVNASISGETTRGGRTRLPALLAEHDPRAVVIALGGNDGLRGVPLAETRRNLAALVEAARGHGAAVLLVGVRLPSNYGRPFIERFQAQFQQVAKEYDVPLVPKFLAGVGERRELIQPDGLHPTAEAQPLLLENLWPALARLLKI